MYNKNAFKLNLNIYQWRQSKVQTIMRLPYFLVLTKNKSFILLLAQLSCVAEAANLHNDAQNPREEGGAERALVASPWSACANVMHRLYWHLGKMHY